MDKFMREFDYKYRGKVEELIKKNPSIRNYIASIGGKPFIEYEGLLLKANEMEIKELSTELIQAPSKDNENTAIFKATAITKDDRIFVSHGDASPSSVGSMVRQHYIRMADTRAKARALRDMTGIGLTSTDELDMSSHKNNQQRQQQTQRQQAPTQRTRTQSNYKSTTQQQTQAQSSQRNPGANDKRIQELQKEVHHCDYKDASGKLCGEEIPWQVAEFSTRKFKGRKLCIEHQKNVSQKLQG